MNDDNVPNITAILFPFIFFFESPWNRHYYLSWTYFQVINFPSSMLLECFRTLSIRWSWPASIMTNRIIELILTSLKHLIKKLKTLCLFMMNEILELPIHTLYFIDYKISWAFVCHFLAKICISFGFWKRLI